MSDKSPSQSFWTYLGQSFGIALWLIPVLAWYEVLKTIAGGWMNDKDSLANKVIYAIILTVIVFFIFVLFNKATNPTSGSYAAAAARAATPLGTF